MSAKKQTFFLIDGPAIYYRAYFAFIRNPLITARGENTSAVYGFTSSLLKIIRDEKPDYIAVAFDTKAPTMRHEKYAAYKANRAAMPEELVAQLPRIQEVVEALRLAAYAIEGYEADDLIATLARQAARENIDVWIVSGDKDLCQLVNSQIHIYNTKKGLDAPERMDSAGVKKRLGVAPEQVIDYLALTGDASDNVPGVPGIGPKTAIALLEQFGALDEILARSSEISSKGVRAKIEENVSGAILSKELVTVHDNAPVTFSREETKSHPPDYDKAKKLFSELQFTAFLKALVPGGVVPTEVIAPSHDDGTHTEMALTNGSLSRTRRVSYTQVRTIEELEGIIDKCLKLTEVAIHTVTTSLDPMSAELVGFSLCDRAGQACYIPLGHSEGGNLLRNEALREIARLCGSSKVQKVGQNIKFAMVALARVGIQTSAIGFDTMLAAYIVNPTTRDYGLDTLALTRFDYKMQPIIDLIGSGKTQISFAEVSVQNATFYSCEVADYSYRLRGVLEPELERLGLETLYRTIELPLVETLQAMEREGVRLDTTLLKKLSNDFEKELDSLEREIYKHAGHKFNINSTQQLSTILFDELKLPTKGKTAKKTGFSTDVRVLEELSPLHPLPKLILEFRQLAKLKSTYIDALPVLINPSTGRVHSTFNQTIAATGRLSSTDPNLQNIPVRTENGREIRRAFIPSDKGRQIMSADYSQIELRILAHLSKDKGLISAFKAGDDIHARTAAEVFGVSIDKVTDDQRRVAKTANFAVIYGVTAYGLSQQSDMDVSASKEFIDKYFKRYPGIKTFIDATLSTARQRGFVETISGRRRYIADLHNKNVAIRQFAERTAVNTPIQGTAADMIKLAMIRIHKDIDGMQSRMILQVHDELVFDVARDEIAALTKIVREGMVEALPLDTPIVVDIGVGDNWLEAK